MPLAQLAIDERDRSGKPQALAAALPVHKLKPRNSRHSLSVEFHLVFKLSPKLVESTSHNCTGSRECATLAFLTGSSLRSPKF
ncbi:hypothetical protein QUB70_30480 [Microcoleus sp. A003_D6]